MTLQNEARFAFKGRLRRPDGELRWVEFTGERLPQPNDGSRRTLIGVAQDVTSREQAAVSMRQNATLFSTLIEQAPMGTSTWSMRSSVLKQVNREAMPIFTSVNPLLGRDFDEVMEIIWGPEDRAARVWPRLPEHPEDWRALHLAALFRAAPRHR